MSHFVYALFDGRGNPFYIGRGKRDRWNTHFRKVNHNLKKVANPHKDAVIRKLIATGKKPVIEWVKCGSDKEAKELEFRLIKMFGRKADGGILTNITEGGEHIFRGRRHTKASKKKIGDYWRGRIRAREGVERSKAFHTGRKRSEETKAKLRAAWKKNKAERLAKWYKARWKRDPVTHEPV